ncbi:MAG TPA: pyridoxamine 5'-phosphate oxidase, partial [Gemmatimonadetes bacterium]|nr:pyridoxamine 5'-phosphate oxidase [Gemmatimonadota bacterium]
MLNLTEIFDSIWEALAKGRVHARDAFHTPAVGTVRAGQPEVRTVVLRHVDSQAGILGFHTDRRSPKVQDLTTESTLAWHFYDHERKVQIRARGSGLVHIDDEVADEAWGEGAPLGRR